MGGQQDKCTHSRRVFFHLSGFTISFVNNFVKSDTKILITHNKFQFNCTEQEFKTLIIIISVLLLVRFSVSDAMINVNEISYECSDCIYFHLT